MIGVYSVTATSGSAFTYTASGSAGTATVTSAVASVDVMNPLTNYTLAANRQGALCVDLSTLSLTANGDGSGATMTATINQEVTPSGDPWFTLIPDQTRIRFAFADTGATPSATDILFLGYLNGLTSQLNDSGLGTITDLDINDVNTMLDSVVVFGKAGGVAQISQGEVTRTSNVVTINTKAAHGFVAGQVVTVAGVIGGGATTFNGAQTISTVPSETRFTYAQTGADYSSNNGMVGYTISLDGRSRTSVILTANGGDSAYIQDGDGILLFRGRVTPTGFANNTTVINLLFDRREYDGGATTFPKYHPPANVQIISPTSIRLLLAGSLGRGTSGSFANATTARVATGTYGRAWDGANTSGQTSVIIKANTDETAAVNLVLGRVNAYHLTDYPLKRLLNTAGTASITGGTAYRPAEAFYLPSTSLRSALDSIVETYQSDSRLRRYYITPQGALSYSLIDLDAVPALATSPYKITTISYGTPNTTTAAASISPFSLTVAYDHDTVKRAQFNTAKSGDSGGVVNTVIDYRDLYKDVTGTAASGSASATYALRSGAPIFESVVDFPNAKESLVQVVASAWMNERHKPLLSGSFQLRGAGTAAHNSLGFFKGYYQSGTAFAVASWAPGQFVDITSPGLGLSGLYRVEQVGLALEPGSYTQVIDVTFNRKPVGDLASIIANQRR
jgi:hypothetical protein